MMKKILVNFFGVMLSLSILSQQPTRLIVRADDMGITHATNLACVDVFTKGIARSVEVMVPAPWFIEAVNFLKEHPEYDAGIHLVLNCEWSNLKWRPLTHAKTLTDSNGYFFPTPWKGSIDFPSLNDNKPDFAEAEKELRAQIEMAKKHLPHLSHLSTHMGFDDSHPELKKIIQKLSEEYHLPFTKQPEVLNFPATKAMSSDKTSEREEAFVAQLSKLEKGKTYLYVTHPTYNTPEMQTIYTNAGYSNVGQDRQADLDLLKSKKVQEALKRNGVELISVSDFFTK